MRLLHALTASVFLLAATGPVAFGANAGHHGAQHSTLARPAVATAHPATQPAAAAGAGTISYHADIEPFLQANCSTCHSADKHTSAFNVEAPDAFLKGGSKNGDKEIVPGKAADSALIAYLRGSKQPRMPLNGAPVPEDQIKKIETWINQGAKIDAIKLGWPYVAPAEHPLPHVKNAAWCRNPIDNFVLAKLEEKGLSPAPPASKVALLRRVYADLVGEPPTPQEADAFVKDASPNAYEKVVDRLLADPRYGERWGRHWLDLVRYADTAGFENDAARPRAWRFRDYVIRSFNEDKPYDRFLKEQIAGDELYPDDPDAIIATGYARLGPWDALSTDPAQRWQDYLNDVTDTTGSVVLGLSVGCAKCHNHKYDRISQKDYYSLQAFFTPTKWVDTRLPNDSAEPVAFRQKVSDAEAQIKSLRQQMDDLKAKYRSVALAEKQQAAKAGDKIDVSDDDIRRSIEKNSQDNETFRHLEDQVRNLEDSVAPMQPMAEAITDGGRNAPVTHLLLRGNLLTPGPEVQPSFVASLCAGQPATAAVTPPSTGNTTGRRTALADWLTSKTNPMTAKVMVNRIWQHHFGRGIVGTPSDFGKNGDAPTHPELLDWLALRFMENGWSIKKMHRLMLLSNTYQMSTRYNPVAAKVDPLNKLFWRMNRIRLEGEALRDSILAVSGRLNPEMGGPGVYPHVSDEVLSTGSTHKWGSSPESEGLRRTVYVFQRRSLVLPIVEAFDGPDMNNTCPRRSTTTIAPQALALFNGDFARTESRYFAGRVVQVAGDDRDKQIDAAYQIALIRRPTPEQKTLAEEFLAKQTQLHLEGTQQVSAPADSKPRKDAQFAALAELCHVLINTNEFLYLD